MIEKFQHAWQLFKASVIVTFRYPKLLWFPFITTILTVFIAIFFLSAMALPAILLHSGIHDQSSWVGSEAARIQAWAASHHPHGDGQNVQWQSLLLLPIYFGSMFLATFFNVAFYSEIMAAFNGRGVSFQRGFATAWSRLPSILAWSLLAGAVGWLIRALEQRLPLAGRILTGFIGIAWSIAAVFAIPIIIQEQSLRNPFKILQHSAQTLKRTWGEGLIGYIGFSAGGWVIFLGSLVPLVLVGGVALLVHSPWLAVIAGVLWVLSLIIIGYISGVAGNVFRCALYLYAAEGVIPEPYDQAMLDMAWKVKNP